MKKLLINYVYYSPVGHLVEAIKHARGYYEMDKSLKISLLVKSESPVELAVACDWIENVYPVSVSEIATSGENASFLQFIPKDWDYVLVDPRTKILKSGYDDDSLIEAQKVLQKVFIGKEVNGITPNRSGLEDEDVSTQTPLPYKLNAHIDIPIPESAKEVVKKYSHNGPVITILPGGSAGNKQSPSLEVWEKICLGFSDTIPNLKINFIGVTKSEKGRTTTQDITLEDIDVLVSKLPKAENCFNIGLWNQLALIKASDIYCSPHSGFSFLSQVVGTPWLAISGCPWPEYFFNDTKFYSVLPDCSSYPSKGNSESGCGKLLSENKKSVCMQDENLYKKIPEIVSGAKTLLDKNFTYLDAVELHLKKIKDSKIILNEFLFFDGIKGMRQNNQHLYRDRKYDVVPYDVNWPSQFEMYASKIKEVFGSNIQVEHIGSTSVPGMSGKPCIDILVVINDLKTVEDRVGEMQEKGFEYAGQFVMKDSRLFRVTKDSALLANIHFFPIGHPHNEEMISLRDYLRAHPEEVTAYSNIKDELYSRYPNDYATYRKHKDEYMDDLVKRVSKI